MSNDRVTIVCFIIVAFILLGHRLYEWDMQYDQNLFPTVVISGGTFFSILFSIDIFKKGKWK